MLQEICFNLNMIQAIITYTCAFHKVVMIMSDGNPVFSFKMKRYQETKSYYRDYPGHAAARIKKKFKRYTCTFAPTGPLFY